MWLTVMFAVSSHGLLLVLREDNCSEVGSISLTGFGLHTSEARRLLLCVVLLLHHELHGRSSSSVDTVQLLIKRRLAQTRTEPRPKLTLSFERTPP